MTELDYKKSKYLIYIPLEVLFGLIIFILILLYSQNFTEIGYLDAMSVTAAIIFAIGWLAYAANHHLFDTIGYGLKSFFMGFAGKKPTKTLSETVEDKQPINKQFYLSFWYTSIIFVVVVIIQFILYYT